MKTDHQLQQEVLAELKWEPSVHAAQIGVEVKDGVVTLVGQVASYGEKWNAEHAALRVRGVNALATALTVQLQSLNPRSDADIAGAVDNVLEWSAQLPRGAIKVMVEGGDVTLSGDVDWQYQKQVAADAVRNLMDVTGVNNQIHVKPWLSGIVVKADIDAALQRAAVLDARDITVTVHGSDVTLSGNVHDWAERQIARNAAWGAPGVRNVVDLMTLAY